MESLIEYLARQTTESVLAGTLIALHRADADFVRLLDEMSGGVFTPEGDGIRVGPVSKSTWLELSAAGGCWRWLQIAPGKRSLCVPMGHEERVRLAELAAFEGLRHAKRIARKAQAAEVA